MRKTLLTVLALGFLGLVSLASARAEDAQRGRANAKLLGAWMIVSGERDGIAIPEARIKSTLVDITGDRIEVEDKLHKKVWVMKYTLDPSKSPKEITMTLLEGDTKGQTAKGTYELREGQLILGYELPATLRTEKTNTDGPVKMKFTMQRAVVGVQSITPNVKPVAKP